MVIVYICIFVFNKVYSMRVMCLRARIHTCICVGLNICVCMCTYVMCLHAGVCT